MCRSTTCAEGISLASDGEGRSFHELVNNVTVSPDCSATAAAEADVRVRALANS
jgi:hypothetical protein